MDFFIEEVKSILNVFNKASLFPVIGVELEFYSNQPINTNSLPDFNIYEVLREEGENHFEAKFQHTLNILELIQNINNFFDFSIKEFDANFSAKPFPNLPGSAMHINISIQNENGENIFLNNIVLGNAIGGLCEMIPNSMIYFAPYVDSYLRYNNGCYHTPINISWGRNNRTTSIRIPENFGLTENTRIEHRLPGSDANIINVICCVLLGVYYGILNKIKPINSTYGIARDPQYRLKNIPLSLNEAMQYATMRQMLEKIIDKKI